MLRFRDRRHAGRLLATHLGRYAMRHDVLVLALPRGGVPVAFEVARALGAPLDVLVVRKLGVPGHPEFAMGAIASGDVSILDRDLVKQLGIARRELDGVLAVELKELHRREQAYRGDRPPPELAGCTVILVDDGLATGSTMLAAVAAVERRNAARVVVAAPVASLDARDALGAVASEVVTVLTPEPFHGVGLWYADFSQTSDAEVRALLAEAARACRPGRREALPDDRAHRAVGA